MDLSIYMIQQHNLCYNGCETAGQARMVIIAVRDFAECKFCDSPKKTLGLTKQDKGCQDVKGTGT
ncbi:hypothetical protein BIV59_15050 [Bacillus sp. MUM 13]|nr:hypothetical protein BIV59_15050 [Bacillus sp. MUM 13]